MAKARVYILYCETYYKIGYSTQAVKSRVAGMATGNPFPIVPILDIQCKSPQFAHTLERDMHAKYRKYREKGEWFSLGSKDVQSIKDFADNLDGVTAIKVINDPPVETLNNSEAENQPDYYRKLWIDKRNELNRSIKRYNDGWAQSNRKVYEMRMTCARTNINTEQRIGNFKKKNIDLRRKLKHAKKLALDQYKLDVLSSLQEIKSKLKL